MERKVRHEFIWVIMAILAYAVLNWVIFYRCTPEIVPRIATPHQKQSMKRHGIWSASIKDNGNIFFVRNGRKIYL